MHNRARPIHFNLPQFINQPLTPGLAPNRFPVKVSSRQPFVLPYRDRGGVPAGQYPRSPSISGSCSAAPRQTGASCLIQLLLFRQTGPLTGPPPRIRCASSMPARATAVVQVDCGPRAAHSSLKAVIVIGVTGSVRGFPEHYPAMMELIDASSSFPAASRACAIRSTSSNRIDLSAYPIA